MNESTLLHDQLLTTKFFIPSASHALIPRSRLNAQLNEGMKHKLTLISAPAGFGKTTLLSAWVQTLPLDNPNVAWVSLDEEDNDPLRFWEYALTALNTCQSELFTPLLTFFQTGQVHSVQSLLTAVINILVKQTEKFLLILDDYHLITDSAVHTSLNFLLEHLPSQLHLILATRADPPLSLPRLRGRNQMLEVRSDQLQCTTEEVLAFFAKTMGIALTSEESQEVEDRTEGWIAGLQLVAISMRGNTDTTAILRELHGSQRYILDYLTDEVLRQQPTILHTFLLRTSILERLCASLCDSVLQQSASQQLLEQLDQANLFVVPLDERRQWYRYHALFAEALRYRLEQTEGEVVSELHLRASQWFAAHGNLSEAVRHAICARNWQRVADLIEPVYAFIWSSNEHAMVRRWLEQIPVEIVRSRPRLCLAYARILYLVVPYSTIARWLQDAERALRLAVAAQTNETADNGAIPLSKRQEQDNLLGEIAAYSAAITAFDLGEGHISLAFCQWALAHLSEQNRLARAEVAYARSLAYFALGDCVSAVQNTREAAVLVQATGNLSARIAYTCRIAYSLLPLGKLHEVVQVAQQASVLGTSPFGLPHAMVSWAFIIQADVSREWNQLDEALELALQGVRLCEQTETIVALYLAYTVLMRIYLARREIDAAKIAFRKAEATFEKIYSSYRRDVFLIVDWVHFWLASGEVERSMRWAQDLVHQDSVSSPLARERQDVARVRVLLAQQQPTEALALLEPLVVRAQQQARWYHVIEIKVLQALAHHLRNEEREATSTLAQALHLAEPQGYIRIFVDEGPPMAALLSRLRAQEPQLGPTTYLDALLAAYGLDTMAIKRQLKRSEQKSTSQPLLESLSERELEVLQLIGSGDSNREIAEELVLSLDTIKRHVYNIFSKLEVKNRVQAVARARTLGLLNEEA